MTPAWSKLRSWDSFLSLEKPLQKPRPVQLPRSAGINSPFCYSLIIHSERPEIFSTHFTKQLRTQTFRNVRKEVFIHLLKTLGFYLFVCFLKRYIVMSQNMKMRILMRKFPMATPLQWNFQNLLWQDPKYSSLGNLGKCIPGSIDKQFSFYYKGLAPFNSAEISQEIQSAEWVTSHFHNIQTKWSLV